ncbi:MAG: hypothetical protein QM764_10065 [Chitinophagaceae bacterium]
MKTNEVRTIIIRGVLLILLSLYFIAVFAQKSPNLISFNANLKSQAVSIQWVLSPANNLSTVIIEKKLADNSFQPIAEFWVNFDGNTQKDFHFTDKKSTAKNSQYRLKLITASNEVQYSEIVTSSAKSSGPSSKVNEAITGKTNESVFAGFKHTDISEDLKSLLLLRLQEREENYL